MSYILFLLLPFGPPQPAGVFSSLAECQAAEVLIYDSGIDARPYCLLSTD